MKHAAEEDEIRGGNMVTLEQAESKLRSHGYRALPFCWIETDTDSAEIEDQCADVDYCPKCGEARCLQIRNKHHLTDDDVWLEVDTVGGHESDGPRNCEDCGKPLSVFILDPIQEVEHYEVCGIPDGEGAKVTLWQGVRSVQTEKPELRARMERVLTAHQGLLGL